MLSDEGDKVRDRSGSEFGSESGSSDDGSGTDSDSDSDQGQKLVAQEFKLPARLQLHCKHIKQHGKEMAGMLHMAAEQFALQRLEIEGKKEISSETPPVKHEDDSNLKLHVLDKIESIEKQVRELSTRLELSRQSKDIEHRVEEQEEMVKSLVETLRATANKVDQMHKEREMELLMVESDSLEGADARALSRQMRQFQAQTKQD